MEDGFLEVGINESGEVWLTIPISSLILNGVGHIVFSPDQARSLARLMASKASEADGFPGTKEEGEYFIDFNTQIQPGKIQAVRVRLDLVTVSNMNVPMDISLVEHPLFSELRKYVAANSDSLGAVLSTVYQMADEEVKRPGDNDQRFRALKRIRAFVKERL
jgi:hypothetical protein